jgi:hypothetical protein
MWNRKVNDSAMKRINIKYRPLFSIRATLKIGTVFIAVLYVFLTDHPADAAPITLGTASNYGVLVGTGQTLALNGSLSIAGNVGVGANSATQSNGINVISGTAYEDSGVSNVNTGITLVTGGVVTASMSNAIGSALSASSAAGALTATAGLVDQGGSITVSGGSVTIKALGNLSENVLYVSSLSLLNGTLTFDDNGFTNAKFIVDITGGFSVNSTGAGRSVIQGINGASADDIIFNIEGTGSTVSLTGNSTNSVIGTVLAPSRSVTVGGGGSLTGAIVAGVNNAGKSYTVGSSSGGYNITGLGYTPRASNSTDTPEPSTILMLTTGTFMLLTVRRRRR